MIGRRGRRGKECGTGRGGAGQGGGVDDAGAESVNSVSFQPGQSSIPLPSDEDLSMTRLHTFLASSLLCLGVSACGDASLLAPEGPRFDGGSTFGGGNRTESDTSTTTERGGFTFGSGNRVVGSTTEGPSTERGGYGIGSGNRMETTTTDTVERGGSTAGSGNRTEGATASATGTTTGTDTTERGGHTIGTGY